MEFIEEKSRDTLIYDYYDTVVVGGGIAGVSAALAAKRSGAEKVLLIEKQYVLGGLATLGLVTIYLPLCDGRGNQVSYGISEELLRLSIRHGAEAKYPDAWLDEGSDTGNEADNEADDKVDDRSDNEADDGSGNETDNRSENEIDNSSGNETDDRSNDRADDKSDRKAGIKGRDKQRFEVRYNPSVFAILMEQLLMKEGVTILYGTAVCGTKIGASGRIEYLLVENKSGRFAIKLKNVVDATGDADICRFSGAKTAMFRQGNVLAAWYYYQEKDLVDLKMLGFADIPDKYKVKDREEAQTRYLGVEAEELSRMTIEAHKTLLEDFLASGGISPSRSLTSIASIPQVRMTRRIDGRYTLDDTEDRKFFEDSVGMISDWRKPGPVYEIPFSCLIGREVKNLITAGRCISVTDSMWDISRAIPACAVTGEAAGTAAALTDDFSQLEIKQLQMLLVRNGVKLHP